MKFSSQRGSAIIMLFVAVALFGLISYVFLQGSGGSTSMITSEASKAAAYQFQDCSNAVSMAAKRLAARGCGKKISYESDGSNPDASAPADGSCSIYHPNGGGVKYCGEVPNPCMAQLAVGEMCAGVIYVGDVGGKRIYTTQYNTSVKEAWDYPTYAATGATSATDGLSNTDIIVTSARSFPAARACRALGEKWYLPSINEMKALHDAGNTGELTGTVVGFGNRIWSSTETATHAAMILRADTGNANVTTKNTSSGVRCMRRD